MKNVLSFKIFTVAIIFFYGSFFPIWADYNLVKGGELFSDVISPSLASSGSSIVYTDSPLATLVNPASTGFLQRFTFELGYTGIHGYGDGATEGWGNFVSAGVSIPFKAGVLNTSLYFLNTNFSYLSSPLLFGTGISFAKDIYDNISVGIGINFGAGLDETDNFEWMLMADLGIIHYPKKILNNNNFRWGVVLKNLGKGFSPNNTFSSQVPTPFTPGIGAGINAYKNDKFEIDATADVLFPFCQNMRVDAAFAFTFLNSFKVKIASRFDIKTLVDDGANIFNFTPSIGLSYGFNKNLNKRNSWKETEFIVDASATALGKDVMGYSGGIRIPIGVIDKEGPEIDVDYPETVYISPNNDGINDNLILPIKIEDKRYLKSYSLTIYDSEGNRVRNYVNKEDRPENLSFKNIFNRLLYVKQGIAVPFELFWDSLDNIRTAVPDGVYTFNIKATDDNNNISVTENFSVVIDTAAPDLALKKDYTYSEKIFSPNDDGNKDTFTIVQSGSNENSWAASISNNVGKVYKTFSWNGKEPKEIVWNGKGDDGVLLEDGVYTYTVMGEDLAGNKTTGTVENIIISTVKTPATMKISKAVFNSKKDTVDFTLDVPVQSGIEKWQIDVFPVEKDKIGSKAVFSIEKNITIDDSTTFILPEKYEFAGKSNGKDLQEGVYRGRLEILYENGNKPEVFSPDFIIDTTAPTAQVTASYNVFSPNSDGRKDFMLLNIKTSKEELWDGGIFTENEEKVRTFDWRGSAEENLEWGGTDDEGRILPDGVYYFLLTSTDAAGNNGKSEKLYFNLDTEETPLILTINYDSFSPNGDDVKDSITFFSVLAKTDGVEKYSFSVKDKNGDIVYEKTGIGKVPEKIEWNIESAPTPIAEGIYTANLEVIYENGNTPTAYSPSFEVDTTYPEVTVSADTFLFSPNGDENLDNVIFTLNSGESKDNWEIIIKNKADKIVFEKKREEISGNFIWDGRDSTGNILENEFYNVTVQAEDLAGNKTSKTIENIELDTRISTAIVSVDNKGFSPNSGGIMDKIGFNLIVSEEIPIKEWKLEIVNEKTNIGIVKTFSGTETVPDTISWDGFSDSGETIATDGIYKAKFTAVYKKGDIGISDTRGFILDTDSPVAEIAISPIPFSPDNDGVDDEAIIEIKFNDLSGIKDWKFEISDPYKNSFRSFLGKGMPPENITWDGIGKGGELVQSAEDYPWVLTAEDNFGNKSTYSGVIPIDVLVVQDGNNLKIKIASINFAPNSPQLVTDNIEIKTKNEKIIYRLAEILNKYSSYKIKIEGHANNLSWSDPIKADEEEEKELIPLSNARCETVKQLLAEKGVTIGRMSGEGVGGLKPVVPFSDTENRWKNRRVEFILIK